MHCVLLLNSPEPNRDPVVREGKWEAVLGMAYGLGLHFACSAPRQEEYEAGSIPVDASCLVFYVLAKHTPPMLQL